MRKVEVSSHLTPVEIKDRMLSSKSRQQFQRWQVIYIMATKGFGAEITADLVGVVVVKHCFHWRKKKHCSKR